MIQDLIQKIKTFDIDKLMHEMMQSQESYILELNKEQLNELGVDSEGNKLRTYLAYGSYPYAFSTIQEKKDKGQPYDHVTLFSQGDYQKSFSAKTDNGFTKVSANSKKADGDISDNLDISKVLGLTIESKDDIIQNLRGIAPFYFKKQF
jgi:hypothetical protein